MAHPATAVRLLQSHCLFLVHDVVKTAEYYRDALGFTFDRYWGDPPCFCIVRRGDVEIFLKGPECPGDEIRVRPNGQQRAWDIYINVTDADALCRELRSKGAKILREPETVIYQQREFEVEDINGYWLCFAHDTSGETA